MWRLRPDCSTPGCCGLCWKCVEPRWAWRFWGYKKCRRDRRRNRRALSLKEEERDESSYPQPDRLEGTCCFSTRVDNGESLVRDCGLDSQQFHTGADGTIILDWSVAPKTAKADPHRALRFVGIRGQDALDSIKLRRTLQENKKLTNIATAQVERALVPWDATARFMERGALRHAAEIVETYNLDPHVISQLAKHVDPFELPQNTVRYLWKYTTMLTQVSSLVTLM
ncbi:hypothetical protein TcYC6_0100880 [Trypanosoma cruzi]|uniref:Uncharacterized protein n=1 Tax=Trypanosoma cruzi TaxID=5693 RepID=A0A7J6YGV8_TRYCR|nr:hypothetical protein ECC02_000934 [Trypanosoma cruzi]KAF8294629.1 hypothetical protein TcYC6_0100880 [Trypanosoma cruzi]